MYTLAGYLRIYITDIIIAMSEIKKIVVNSVDGQREYGIEDSQARQNVQEIVEGAPEELDSFREAFEAFKEGDEALASVYTAVQANAKAIAEEAERAEQAEQEIKGKAVEADSLDSQIRANEVALGYKTIEGVGGEITIPAATTEKAGVMSAADKKVLDAVPSKIKSAINEESKVTDEKIATEIDKLKNGDTIVGQAREIHSRNGKNDSASFLMRTTAGSGTIGDGVATLKSVGGNIVKNLVDGTSVSKWTPTAGTARIGYSNGIFSMEDIKGINYTSISWGATLDNALRINGHAYYYHANIYACNSNGNDVIFGISNMAGSYLSGSVGIIHGDGWQSLSFVTNAPVSSNYYGCAIVDIRQDKTIPIYMSCPVVIDLTETYGATIADKLTKEECDKLFGTMDALPQGLSIANPSIFKSTGFNQFNQFNPDMVLEGKAIINNAIENGDNTLAVIPCLPCKIGAGENNGYCIHGDGVTADTKVYLTPLNPKEVTGELYMHELALSEKGTYVPQIKGYMIVEVPTTTNLCAHFLWSEDCDKNVYEPYYESVIELPRIPEMSEYGLAGYTHGNSIRQDIINLEKEIYNKRIYSIDLGEQQWYGTNLGVDNLFVMNFPSGAKPKSQGDGIIGIYSRHLGDSTTTPDKHYLFTKTQIYIRDSAISTVTQMKSALQGVVAYYASDIIEYPLPKIDNNYISSDYGVEQFDGGVPCNANNLYYMRSLAGETRNFLDRLMAGLGTTDATALADRILAVVNPAIEPVNEIEP